MNKTNEPKKPGRPPTLKGGKDIKVHLDSDTIEKASKLGNGNISLGIRKAVFNIHQENIMELIKNIELTESGVAKFNTFYSCLPGYCFLRSVHTLRTE